MEVRQQFEILLSQIKGIEYQGENTLDKVREIVQSALSLMTDNSISLNYVNAFNLYVEKTRQHRCRTGSKQFANFRDGIANDIQSVIWELNRYGF